jgi:hypothetical protein
MNNDSGNPTLVNVNFSANLAENSGGGMYNDYSNPSLLNVSFSGNSADYGGAVYNVLVDEASLVNVSIVGNSAIVHGGGIYNWTSNPTLTNVTVSGNSATMNGGGIFNYDSLLNVHNSILWNNQDESGTGTISATIYCESSTVTLTNSLAQDTGGSGVGWVGGSYVDGGDNLDTDPLFKEDVDPSLAPSTGGDLHLQSSSPAVDTGDYSFVSGISTDLDGNPRISGGTVDMGAYEFQFYNLTVSLAGSGSGSVSSTPSGIECGTDCLEIYADGTVVTLTATADLGSTFTGWTGACTNTTGDCVVTMSATHLVTATFTLNQYQLTISHTDDGSGLVSSTPGGISCGTDCIESYNYGTVVTLTATPDTGSTFVGWSGACTNSSGDCVVTMTAARSVIATFSLNQYPLSVSLAGDGNGVVSSTPAGIECGTDCTHSYGYGTMVSLTAAADSGFIFSGWGGACTGSGDCEVTMTEALSVTATFDADFVYLPLIIR